MKCFVDISVNPLPEVFGTPPPSRTEFTSLEGSRVNPLRGAYTYLVILMRVELIPEP